MSEGPEDALGAHVWVAETKVDGGVHVEQLGEPVNAYAFKGHALNSLKRDATNADHRRRALIVWTPARLYRRWNTVDCCFFL